MNNAHHKGCEQCTAHDSLYMFLNNWQWADKVLHGDKSRHQVLNIQYVLFWIPRIRNYSVCVCVCQCVCMYKNTCVPPRPDWLVFAHQCALCCPWCTEGFGRLQEREAHKKVLDHPQPATCNTFNTIKSITIKGCYNIQEISCLLHGDEED